MQIDKSKLPKHIAIIMDGNGRWAKKRHLPKTLGYRAGVRSAVEMIKFAKELGIKALTLYTFSTENWSRAKRDVDILMGILEEHLDKEIDALIKEGVRIRAIGKVSALPSKVQMKIRKVEEKTLHNKALLVNIALNYGGRAEIVNATKKICEEVTRGALKPDDISEQKFSDYLYTIGTPDPDLLIRTSGEMRVSNFLLWQISYTEIYITRKLWPDFRRSDLEKAILNYQKRERRYGA